MGNRSPLQLIPALAMLLLNGCASISKNECLSANWEDVGIRDGANGQPEEYLIRHSTACAKVGVTPDRSAWLKGRERGLERFCVPQRAYRIGESGGGFDVGICRNFDEERLLGAYERGREVNRLASVLGSIDSEMGNIRATLERKDLEPKQRESLAYRLGQLEAQRYQAQRDYDDARYRAQNL
jgi:hypothetical protein